MRKLRSIVSIILGAAIAASSAAVAKPRAVSLDYCSDQYLLKLADPDQIAAVSRGADKDYSYMRSAAAGVQKIRPTIEETAPLTPDAETRRANAPSTRRCSVLLASKSPEGCGARS